MSLIPQLNTVLSIVDSIHRRSGYEGERFAFGPFLSKFPGFLLIEDPTVRGSALAIMIRHRGCARITYRPGAPLAQLRFAIAQQVGHALLHARHMPEYGLRTSHACTPDARVRQARAFAAELLVPLWALERRLSTGTELEPVALRGLALHFGVSQSVVRIQVETYRQLMGTQAGRSK